jgi:hypothetical protein
MSAFDSASFESWAEQNDVAGDPPKGENDWPDPEPICNELRAVAPLRQDMIPEPLRASIVDIAYRMQCPLDFVASAAICMVSGVIGAGCTIRPKERDNWSVVPNLWGGIIARPGMKKSPAIEEAFRPLRRLEIKAREQYEANESSYAAEKAAFESQKKAIKAEMDRRAAKGGDIEEIKEHYANLKPLVCPKRKRFLTNDTTIEKAHELMAENPRGLTILRDELVGLLVTWDREDRKDDRYFHLQGWNGYGGYTSDRIGRGTIDTPQLCEVIFGGIQPSKLLGYLALARSDIANDGLLQRFQLLVYPDEPAGEPKIVDEYPNREAKDRVFSIVETLAEMDFTAYGAETDEFTKIPYFHFAPDAQEFFNARLLELEVKLRSNDEDPVIVEHLAKYRSLMPSLALIFHLIEAADQTVTGHDFILTEPQNEISLRSVQQAAEWCSYLETHARRIYGLATNIAVQSARRLLEKIKDASLEDGFRVRDVYRQGWMFLDSKELAQAAIDELFEAGWLRQIPPPKQPQGGRPFSPAFQIHPNAREILRSES